MLIRRNKHIRVHISTIASTHRLRESEITAILQKIYRGTVPLATLSTLEFNQVVAVLHEGRSCRN